MLLLVGLWTIVVFWMTSLQRIGNFANWASDEDWEAIALVAPVLKSFRSATTKCLRRSTHAVLDPRIISADYRIQLADSLRLLPNNTPASLRRGLLNAIGNLVTTTGNPMITILYLGLTYVLHPIMIHYLANKFISSWSSDIIVAFSQTVVMIWMPVPTLRPPKNASCTISVHKYTNNLRPRSTCHINLCDEQLSSERWFHISLPKTSSAFTDEVQEYFKLHRENFDTVIHCNGGLVAVHSSLTSLLFARDILQFLVSSQLISSCYSITNVSYLEAMQVSAVAVERIFQEAVIQFLSACKPQPRDIRTLMLVNSGGFALLALLFMTFSR